MNDIDRLRLTIRRSTATLVFVLALVGVVVHDAAFVVHGYYPTDAPNTAYLLTLVVLIVSTGYLLFSLVLASGSSADEDPGRETETTPETTDD